MQLICNMTGLLLARSLGMQERRDTSTLKKIAEKEYHLTKKLDQYVPS